MLSSLPASTVVSIDFGTTYSGIAYSFVGSHGSVINIGAPGETHSSKTVTSVVTDSGGKLVSFGRVAEDEYFRNKNGAHYLFKEFKMALFEAKVGIVPEVTSIDGRLRLPVTTVIAASLEALKNYALKKIMKESTLLIRAIDIQWVVTIPAIWTATAKHVMRATAKTAGLIEDISSDRLIFALEPEAATLSEVDTSTPHGLKANDKLVVLDCGGGTIDTTCYLIQTISPTLEVSELVAPSGCPYGGACIDARIVDFIKELIGAARYKHFAQCNPAANHDLLSLISSMKESYQMGSTAQINVTPLFEDKDLASISIKELAASYTSKHPTTSVTAVGHSRLRLSKELMCALYEPVIKNITSHMNQLLRVPELAGASKVLLVGGFSLFTPLRAAVKDQINSSLQLIVPKRPREAVVRGAVLFGLNPKANIKTRVSAYTYGLEHSEFDDLAKHDKSRHVYDPSLGQYVVDEVFHEYVKQGQKIPVDHQITETYYPVHKGQRTIKSEIFSGQCTTPPLYIDDPALTKLGVFSVPCDPSLNPDDNECTVTFQFGLTEIVIKARNVRTGQEVNLAIDNE
ncbi:hypothetical protein SARC_06931 [Sphaeroforma arctica JP610]|uniref:Uncharacterized protein n=1 Tax=Sphaeroforma arctica JP610 TaxID=667725 RepID=A0A0L0FV35_9EUKA|nr:hypothetical protein SARC_06931 [Sphaeroforma arctica JP610]KNC80710.1 hypothetical protein SARC_06931 [Sphaeroforma arctica JP610]|eukprot:XP_014154612.1 hypothetical protein SARC_06931 [Sphaeroforma arctica JP610]